MTLNRESNLVSNTIVHLAFLKLILLMVVKILLENRKYRKVKEDKEDCLIVGDLIHIIHHGTANTLIVIKSTY